MEETVEHIAGHILGLYWSPRRESPEDCALRLQAFLGAIQGLGGPFSRWGETGWSLAEALQKGFDPDDLSTLVRIVEDGTLRNDVDHAPIEGLGFTFGLWNMEDGEQALGLTVHCGMSKAVPGLMGNVVTLGFPDDLISSLGVDLLVEVLAAGARAWRPRWGGVFSFDALLEQRHDLDTPLVEWLLYLDGDFASVGDLQPPSRVVPVDGIGTIVVVQDTPPGAGRDASREAIAAVEGSLRL